jgi:hypothetical protein
VIQSGSNLFSRSLQLSQALVYRRFDSCGQSTPAGSEFDRKKRISTDEARLHNSTRLPPSERTSVTKALDYAHDAAKAWIEGLDVRPVAARATLSQLRNTFQQALPETGMKAEEVIRWIAENANDGMLGSAGGRFFAWVIGGSLESALAADWLVATWDQNAALYACSPAAAVIEEAAGEWIKSLLDLPREASFAFTTGCQLAHVTSLAAARYAVIKRANWDV